jgi:transcriptional regulator with XRE-family HTH domain
MPEKVKEKLSFQSKFQFNLRVLIKKKGLEVETLAKRCGITKAYLHYCLGPKYNSNPSLKVLHKLRSELGCTWEELLD